MDKPCQYITLYPGVKSGQTTVSKNQLVELIINLDTYINQPWPPYFKDNNWHQPDYEFKKGYIKHLLFIYRSIYTYPGP